MLVNIKVLSFFQLSVSISCPGFFEKPWVAFIKQSITSGDGDSQNGFSWRRINLKGGDPNSKSFVVEMDMDGKYYNLILEALRKQQNHLTFFDDISGVRPTSDAWKAWTRLTRNKYVEFRTSVIEYLSTNFVIQRPADCVGRFMHDALFNDWFVNIFSGTERRDVEDGYVPWPSNYPNRLTFHQLCRENGATCCLAFKAIRNPNRGLHDYDKISCCKENTRLFYKNNGETEILKFFWEPHDCQSGAFSRIKIVIPELSTSATHFTPVTLHLSTDNHIVHNFTI